MLDFKKQIDELCDYALLHSDVPENFDIHDLSNATQVFNHVVANLMWQSSVERNLTVPDATKRAVEFGKQLRQLVIAATGLDLHDTFGSVLDDEVIESSEC